MTILMTGGDPIPEDDWYYDEDEPVECSWCCGEGWQENDDPLWYGFDRDWVPCEACGGRGHSQKIF